MAVAAARPPTLDLERSAKFPIRLGASITKPTTSSSYSSVRYNHRRKTGGTAETVCTITPGDDVEHSVLRYEDGNEEDRYEGQHSRTANNYVLIIRDDGKEKSAVLEKLNHVHAYNLVHSSSGKTDEYPQISLHDDADGLFGDDDLEEPIDPDNPFDFRHFLKVVVEKAKAKSAQPSRNTANTPLVQPGPANSTPTARPSKPTNAALLPTKKRKAPVPAEKPSVKRVKASHEADPVTHKDVGKTEAPKIRMDRKASVRRPSYDDDGELVLENETPVTAKLPVPRNAMSLALSGQLGPGPISLRSAASSPASQVASPMANRPGGVEEDEGEFEIGGSSPDETNKPARQVHSRAEEEGDADEEDEDADVEDLELPSPAAVHKPSISAATVTSADDEDDLDKQLALAMAEQDDGGGTAPVVEDEEESEEE